MTAIQDKNVVLLSIIPYCRKCPTRTLKPIVAFLSEITVNLNNCNNVVPILLYFNCVAIHAKPMCYNIRHERHERDNN